MEPPSLSAHALAAVIVIAALVLPACMTTAEIRANYARQSAGSVGCKPDEILIRDEEPGDYQTPSTWTAY